MTSSGIARARNSVVVAALVLGASATRAQTPPPSVYTVPVGIASGTHDNASAVEKMVWQRPVQVEHASWLKLRLSSAVLPGGSRIEITSFEDRLTQHLDQLAMNDWFPHSAYFNGDAVLVRLFAGPFTRGVSVAVEAAEIGIPPIRVDSICGTDDRVLSNDKRVGRLMPAGCTAWIGTRHGLIFTAGHCAAKFAQIVQFNVPLSSSSGSKMHPPPDDQFPLIRILGGFANPNACDWAIYTPGQNGLQQLPLQRQGNYLRLATQMPAVNSTLRITGYGVHFQKPTWNQVQKTVTGPFTGMGNGSCGPYLTRYLVDSINGDSGAPVIEEAGGTVVAVHSGGDCMGSIGANQGSGILNPDIHRILANPNPPPGGPIVRGDLTMSHSGAQLATRVVHIAKKNGTMTTFNWGGSALTGLSMAPNNVDFMMLDNANQDHVVQVTPTGAMTTIATLGTNVTPTAIELDQDGSWLVSSTDNHVRRVTPAGVVTTVVSVPVRVFERVNDIARDHDTGHFIAGVWQTGELLEIDADAGRILRTITRSTQAFYGVDVEPRTGNYVVISISSPEVRVYDRQGTVLRSWSFPYLFTVEVDDQTGNYYCAGAGSVVEFTPQGTKVNHHGPYASLRFNGVDKYGARQVVGVGSARPGTSYSVQFMFHGMGLSPYYAALSLAQRPGIVVGSEVLNLKSDGLFRASRAGALVSGFTGVLDAQGRASGTIRIPGSVPKGLTFFCSAIAIRGSVAQLGNTIGVTVR